jgi:hypothetical protein
MDWQALFYKMLKKRGGEAATDARLPEQLSCVGSASRRDVGKGLNLELGWPESSQYCDFHEQVDNRSVGLQPISFS